METRQKTQYKCYVLNLADMHGGVDESVAVAIFSDIEKLKNYYNSHLALETWVDDPSDDNFGNSHSWQKVFKKGSPLEWYNPLSPVNNSGNDIFDVVSYQNAAFGGVTEYWVDVFPNQSDFRIPLDPQ